MDRLGYGELVEYGIHNEESDLRAHVSFATGQVYVFPTANGRAAIRTGRYGTKGAYQPGYDFPTGLGYLVPPFEVEGCREVAIPADLVARANCQRDESTTSKGRKAVIVVHNMLLRGLIPITLCPALVTRKDLQIRGEDITVRGQATIQVKCDYSAGRRELGGTGYLYLQIAERNPARAH